ncbi:TonB-dependent receptor plug domain-containing protein [Methylomonas sp. HW2-6]|uniref:TonB-dependent receptor plug domain-containing protein n=1 Tax=Methylomonas sp. HW2-6 TaxID=3376687 RepID=UPI0040421677
MIHKAYLAVVFAGFSVLVPVCADATDAERQPVTEMDTADLLNMQVISTRKKSQVTSVSKKAGYVSNAPSAVYVISNEDIKRAGVTSVPEALRLAPGVDVARVNSSKWAVSIRGFNGIFANKLLVMIDGRSVYNPGFSGVYWDAQDVMLEDVERIEVIRGPAATLWGANAVNGVINIISKRAEDTGGGLVTGGGGTLETGFGALRYGKQLGDDSFGRVYVKGFQRDGLEQVEGFAPSADRWDKQQGGFRIDSHLSDRDEWTLQGDLYRSGLSQNALLPVLSSPFQQGLIENFSTSGANILSRLRHTFSTTAEYSLQFYYDHSERGNHTFAKQSLDTLDLDFQNSFAIGERQRAIWGVGYRANLDEFSDSLLIQPTRLKRDTHLFTAFVQDEIMLVDDKLWLTLGSKFEHNPYSGFEGQPTARLMWAPTLEQRVWAAFSRAVRTPSRADHDIRFLNGVLPTEVPGLGTLPTEVVLNGNRSFRAEDVLSYELGYRFAWASQASLDLTAFYNDYDNLTAYQAGTPSLLATPVLHLVQPVSVSNLGQADTYGFEAAAVWQMADWWRWDANYSLLKTEFGTFVGLAQQTSPQHNLSLRAAINPTDRISLDFWLRYTGPRSVVGNGAGNQLRQLNGRASFDTRLAWKVLPSLELSVVGQNLLDDGRLEYIDESGIIQPGGVSRGVYGKLALEF